MAGGRKVTAALNEAYALFIKRDFDHFVGKEGKDEKQGLDFCSGGRTCALLCDRGNAGQAAHQNRPAGKTFTVGDIRIELTESENLNLKMVPGNAIFKDPKVTVKPGSEACWLFVELHASENLEDFLTYSVDLGADGWTQLTNADGSEVAGVFYRSVDAETAQTGASCYVLENNTVTVNREVTKQQLGALTEETYPRLTFTAYAVQSDNIPDVRDAWAQAKG